MTEEIEKRLKAMSARADKRKGMLDVAKRAIDADDQKGAINVLIAIVEDLCKEYE